MFINMKDKWKDTGEREREIRCKWNEWISKLDSHSIYSSIHSNRSNFFTYINIDVLNMYSCCWYFVLFYWFIAFIVESIITVNILLTKTSWINLNISLYLFIILDYDLYYRYLSSTSFSALTVSTGILLLLNWKLIFYIHFYCFLLARPITMSLTMLATEFS